MRTALPCAVALTLAFVSGCEALKATVSQAPNAYSLADARPDTTPARPRPLPGGAGLTLVVSTPQAAAGFDSPRMMYVRQADKLEYFAHNEWVDTPARMMAPLIVSAVERSGAFRAVVQIPSPASGELRLDTEILRLQQNFLGKPSEVRFTLRAYIVETATRQVLATREFEAVVPSASENPQGGVAAATQAVRAVLDKLSVFCAETAANWQPSASGPKRAGG